MTTVPASNFVSVIPGVLAAGGSQLDLVGLFIDNSVNRVPIGAVQSFPDAASVGAFFGTSSTMYARALTYFAGFDNSDVKPGSMKVATWPAADVYAWLRGASVASLTLAQLQAINGTLAFTIDGVSKSGSINLAAATSFTNAAQIIAETLEIDGAATGASCHGGMGASITSATAGLGNDVAFTGVTGVIHPGDGNVLTGTNIPANTTILAQVSGSAGSDGTYTLNQACTAAGTAATVASPTLDVTVMNSGVMATNTIIVGSGVTDDTYVVGFGTGTGSTGTYTTNTSQTVAPNTVMNFYAPGVIYDSVSGAFVVISGTSGGASTMTYGSGTTATALGLTQTAGATISQGSAAQTPAAFMAGVIMVSQDWASFSLTWNPDASGITQRLAFAQWNATQNNRWHCILRDDDTAPAASSSVPASLGAQVKSLNLSGTTVIWGGGNATYYYDAFLSGLEASINLNETNGRTTAAYRSQSGLLPPVTDALTMSNLVANGYNFYVAVATANQGFEYFWPGSVSGPFLWIDSYVDQIWLNNNFQLDMMLMLTQNKSIPYNTDGNTLVETTLLSTIDGAVSAGVIRQNVTPSSAQAAAVNADAGRKIDGVLATRGWYLLVQADQTSPAVRQARGSPPAKFWYMDGQSIQKINLSSIELA